MVARIANLAGPASHRRTLIVSALHVALIWLLAAIVIWQNHQHSIDAWKNSAERISRTVAAHAAQTQRAAELTLTSIADWIDEQDIQSEARFRELASERRFFETLRDRVMALPQADMAVVAAANGDVLSTASRWPPAEANVADREEFQLAMAADRPEIVVGAPARTDDGAWRFFLARKLATRSGVPLGMVGVGLNADYFATFYGSLRLGEGGWISLFRSDGTLLATSLPNMDLLANRFDAAPPHRMIQEGRSGRAALTRGAFIDDTAGDQTRIIVATKVEGFPAYVGVAIGESIYRWPLRTRENLVVGIALLLTMLTAWAALLIVRLVDRSETMRRAESERQVLATIVDTPSALTAVVSPAGKVLHCNTRFRELLANGGQATEALFDPRLKGASALIAFAAGGEGRTSEVDLECEPSSAGSKRRLHFSLSRQTLPDTGDCVVMIGHDETQRHQAQQAIAMSARLVTLGEITTSIAHEVSQPLNVIRMAAQNALVESDAHPMARTEAATLTPMSDSEFRRFAIAKFHRIVAQVDRAADILSRMRIFSRKPGEDGHVLEAQAACRKALGLILPQLRRDGIRVKESFPGEPLHAKGSQTLMEQVLVYLLRNARDALIESGQAEKTIEISASRGPGDRILMRIADNGPGVPAAIRERIFEPFFTTKPSDQNTGLGLALAFGAVRDSAGSLTLLETTAGAAFQIDLPAHPAA